MGDVIDWNQFAGPSDYKPSEVEPALLAIASVSDKAAMGGFTIECCSRWETTTPGNSTRQRLQPCRVSQSTSEVITNGCGELHGLRANSQSGFWLQPPGEMGGSSCCNPCPNAYDCLEPQAGSLGDRSSAALGEGLRCAMGRSSGATAVGRGTPTFLAAPQRYSHRFACPQRRRWHRRSARRCSRARAPPTVTRRAA